MNWLGIVLIGIAAWLGWREHQFLERAAIVVGKVRDIAPAGKGWRAATVEYVVPDPEAQSLRHANLLARASSGRFEVGDKVRVAYILAPDGSTDARLAGFPDLFGWALSLFAIGLFFLFMHLGFAYGEAWSRFLYPFAQEYS